MLRPSSLPSSAVRTHEAQKGLRTWTEPCLHWGVPPVNDAWVAAENTVLAPLAPAGGGGGGGLAWASGDGINGPVVTDGVTEYYLVFRTGGAVGSPAVRGGGMTQVAEKTETFRLRIPDPGSCVRLAGLGLMALACIVNLFPSSWHFQTNRLGGFR